MRSLYGLTGAMMAASLLHGDQSYSPTFYRRSEPNTRPRAPGQQDTVYRPPQPDHAAHLSRAEAKRERRAAKLRAISTGGDHG